MAPRTECYVDTSALIAALDRSDSHHSLYARLFGAPPPLVRSALVVAEGHGWFLRRYHQQKAIQFLHFIRELSPLTVLPFGARELGSVSVLLKKFADQNVTLADMHGLIVMRDRRIQVCWSTDRHLALTGVRLVM
jgi:predicted nucleic acid-binding protein